jgi:hypothetical protein
VLAKLRAHYTTHANPQTKKSEKRKDKDRNKRVALDGGGARLADAATRHHLTQTRKTKRKEKNKKKKTR